MNKKKVQKIVHLLK